MISKSQIKHIRSLHTKKQRLIENCFIAEGVKTVMEIVKERPDIITDIFCTNDFAEENQRILDSKKINHASITEQELKQISNLTTPNQVIAICSNIPSKKISTDLNKEFSFYLDDIRDPGNLGTIIRICSWFGIKDLFCSPETVEIYNPKCIQASMGAFLRVNIHYVDLKDLIAEAKIENVYATVLNGKNIYDQTLKGGLVIIGNEANGISGDALKLAKDSLTIPAATDNTESLNAAIATSIIASEFFRRK